MGKPYITLREVTKWVETVNSEWNILVGADKDKIAKAVRELKPKGKPT